MVGASRPDLAAPSYWKASFVLSVPAIDSGNMIVRLVGKGNKERILASASELAAGAARRLAPPPASPPAVSQSQGIRPFSEKSLRRALADASDRLGLSVGITAHSTCHWLGTSLQANGTWGRPAGARVWARWGSGADGTLAANAQRHQWPLRLSISCWAQRRLWFTFWSKVSYKHSNLDSVRIKAPPVPRRC